MTEKDYVKLTIVAAAGLLVYWWMGRKKAAQQATADQPNEGVNPILDTYANNPSAFGLHQLTPPNINVNVGNQGLAYLSNKYVPLFGFVGMAGGWQ